MCSYISSKLSNQGNSGWTSIMASTTILNITLRQILLSPPLCVLYPLPYGVSSTSCQGLMRHSTEEEGWKAEVIVWQYWDEVMLTLGQDLSVKYPPYKAPTEG